MRDRRSGRLDRTQGRQAVREPGILDGFEISREEAESLVMQARLKAGWVDEAALAPPAPAEEAAQPEAQA